MGLGRSCHPVDARRRRTEPTPPDQPAPLGRVRHQRCQLARSDEPILRGGESSHGVIHAPNVGDELPRAVTIFV